MAFIDHNILPHDFLEVVAIIHTYFVAGDEDVFCCPLFRKDTLKNTTKLKMNLKPFMNGPLVDVEK